MARYKALIAYDGTAYHGWQVQDGVPTVAGALESTFLHVFQKPIRFLATSRTDTGVHALGQVATFGITFSWIAHSLLFPISDFIIVSQCHSKNLKKHYRFL